MTQQWDRSSDSGLSDSGLANSGLSDSYRRGLDYLYQVRSVALEPDLISLVYDSEARVPICTWIGTEIERVNARLNRLLENCQDCFHPWERRPMQIFAAPFSSKFALDGICSLHVDPTAILVDVGRVRSTDWIALIMHEFAHAHLNAPGHQAEFQQVLKHLSIALDIDPAFPPPSEDIAAWQSFPPYRRTPNPLAFWLGLEAFVP